MMRIAIAFALLALTACTAPAWEPDDQPWLQDGEGYKPMGAPHNPKVPVRWNRYYSHAEISGILKALAKAHSKVAKLQSLGKSYGKRDMWVITITNFETGTDKPGFWIDGGIHANELQGPEVALYTAWFLCETWGRIDRITRLLNERVFYILPMLSPDSRDAHMREPNTTHSPRSGQRPVDDDRDGLVDEDKPDDLDGDGSITRMRIRDPNGRWKRHPKYPQLMVRCETDETGEFTVLGSEGIDNDGDGRVNEDGDGYYDPNRDWAWNWQPSYAQRGAHRYPFSILENRMVADFVKAHTNISGAQSYHNTGGMILYGPGAKDDKYESGDMRVYEAIGKKGEEMLPGYRYLNIANDLYEVYGGEVDWLYAMEGIYAFTNELFTPFNLFRKESGGGWSGRGEAMHKFNELLLFGEGLVEWKEIDHPQYGKIEVGGMKKSWSRQPPSFLLEEECHRNMAFTLYHADQMPRVEIGDVVVKELPGGLKEVRAAVSNPRVTPTHAAVDVKNRITPPDRITIEGAGKVIAGFVAEDRFFEKAREQKRKPATLKVRSIGGMSVVYVKWLVQGDGPFTVRCVSVKGGTATGNPE